MTNWQETLHYYYRLLRVSSTKPYIGSIIDWYQEKCKIHLDEYDVEEINNEQFKNRREKNYAYIVGHPYEAMFPCISWLKIFLGDEQ